MRSELATQVQQQVQGAKLALDVHFEKFDGMMQQKYEGLAQATRSMQDQTSESLKSQTAKLTISEEKQASLASDVRHLQDRVAKAEERVHECERMLQIMHSSSLDRLDDALRNARTHLDGRIDDAEKTQKDCHQHLQRELQRELDRWSSRSEQLQGDIREAMQHHTDLEKRVRKMEDEMPELQVNRQTFVEIRNSVQQIDSRTKDVPSGKETLTEMGQRVLRLEHLQERLAGVEEGQKALMSEVRGKVSELEAQTREMPDLKRKLSEHGVKIDAAGTVKDHCDALSAQVQQCSEIISKVVPRVDGLSSKVAEISEKEAGLDSRLEAFRSDSVRTDTFNSEHRRLQERVESLAGDLEGTRRELTKAKTTLAEAARNL
eukprot:CAMPEP_0178462798 /NCGR_PEP_ID=MMETSP0689_2-20121128/50005_1 /TAXON_ID=160604 /ORGANISM="Amphidinium massartii, Strain CS-259" /LENGTH=375 /DNA_ID=CAMNT_0020089665 /DNA_START=143 /DNA_END=1270 /DNA_ORIENTATION=+